MKSKILWVLVILGCLFLAAVHAGVYGLVLGLSRLVIAFYSARMGVYMLSGKARGLLPFLAGLGGLLYVLSMVPELLHHPVKINHRDFALLTRAVGGAFLILPLALDRLPVVLRRRLGLPCGESDRAVPL